MYKFPTYAEANLAAAGIFAAGHRTNPQATVKPLQVQAYSEPNLARYLTVPTASNHGSRTEMEEDVAVPASSSASLPTEVKFLTDAALWLYAAQMLEELAASAAEEPTHEQKVATARRPNTSHHANNITSASDPNITFPSPPSLPSCSSSDQHAAPPTSPKPSTRFDTTIKCRSTPACESLEFDTIQDYQRHLMSHVANNTSPTTSRRRSSKASTAAAQRWPGQRLQKKNLMSPPQHRRSLPNATRAIAMDHEGGSAHHLRTSSSSSLTSQMAALSIKDHHRRTDSMTGAHLSRSL